MSRDTVCATARTFLCGVAASKSTTALSPLSTVVTTRRTFSLRAIAAFRSCLAFNHHAPDPGNRLGRVEILGACLCAIHDGVAAVKPERIFQIVQALACCLVAAVLDPATRLQKCSRAEKTLAVPPIAGAGGRAARAQDAFIEAVKLLSILVALFPFLRRGGRDGLQPGLDGSVLGVEIAQIRDEVLHHGLMWQWIDLHLAFDLRCRLGACERVRAADVHRAGSAHAFPAGPAEGQGRIDVVLDPDKGGQ